VGEDGTRDGGELHSGASRRGGSGPTAAYHYKPLITIVKTRCSDGGRERGLLTPRHSSHSPAFSLCR